MQPSAAVTISYVNKIHRPVVFASPLYNFNPVRYSRNSAAVVLF